MGKEGVFYTMWEQDREKGFLKADDKLNGTVV